MDRRGTSAGAQRRTELGAATKGRRTGADRLSALPDELLLHILSFLDILKAVSTSRLSRRWRYLYHDLPSLNFSEGFDNDSAWFIDRVLLFHTAPHIEVFRLSMRILREDSSAYRQMDSRLLFAVRRGVRVLDLDIGVGDPDVDYANDVRYGLPPWVFQCRTLEDFSVGNCDLHLLPSHVRLVSLKKMCLRRMEFYGDELKRLLLGCPLLQSLELVHCNNDSDLVIDARESQKLEELVICDHIDGDNYSSPFGVEVQIYAPSVKYLTCIGYALKRQYEVRDLSSVVMASFHLNVEGGRVVYEDEADVFTTGLLLRIPQVQVLELSRWPLQALSIRELRGDLVSALLGVTTLKLTMWFQKEELLAILSALRACNKLRTLVISIRHMRIMAFGNRDAYETESLQLLALDSDIVMQDLKTIVIEDLPIYIYQALGKEGSEADNFVAQKKENAIVLLGFLLEVSPVLEKLIVQPAKGMDRMARKWELHFNISSDLLSLPKASPNAKVIIDRK